MSPPIQEAFVPRQSERREVAADYFAAAEVERRGYADRRAGAEWQYSWLRERVRLSLRD